jgi:SAM-dependent methyltransferase
MDEEDDVPSPIDLRLEADARDWAAQAFVRRPFRHAFFDRFVQALQQQRAGRVLELGSGPGFLAERVLQGLPDVRYTAFDFSPAMHALASQRLAPFAGRVDFVERSFRNAGCLDDLGVFDAAITHQSLHELRHKRHAPALHAQVLKALSPSGVYLVCDHFVGEGGMGDASLYMTIDEQRSALEGAGFAPVEQLWSHEGLALHRGRKPGG